MESSIGVSTTEGSIIASPNVAGLTATVISPASPVKPVLPAATRMVLPATGSGLETTPSTARVPNVPAGNPPQVVQPIPFEEAPPLLESEAFEEVSFEDQSASGGATVTAGGAVSIAGNGAIAGPGAGAMVG